MQILFTVRLGLDDSIERSTQFQVTRNGSKAHQSSRISKTHQGSSEWQYASAPESVDCKTIKSKSVAITIQLLPMVPSPLFAHQTTPVAWTQFPITVSFSGSNIQTH